MSNIKRLLHGVPGGGAIALAAASATFGATTCASVVRVRFDGTHLIVSRVAFLAPPDGTWSASWESISGPAAEFPRAALEQLVRTTAQLGIALLIVAALSLMLHAVSRFLGQWRSLAIRLALGAPFRSLVAHAGAGLWAWGVVGCGSGLLAGAAAVTGLSTTWPQILERPPEVGSTAFVGIVVAAAVTLLLGFVTFALLWIVHRGVRVISDLHGDHVTIRGPMLAAQSVLAVTQLAGLLVAVYASALMLKSGVPAILQPVLHPYADSLTVTPLRWTGHDAGAPAARAAASLAIVRAAESESLHVALASPDAWPGLGKPLELVSVCGQCAIGVDPVPMFVAKVRVIAVGPAALTRMGVQVVRGRDLELGDSTGAPRVAILNGVAADRLFTRGDPLGQAVMATFQTQDRYEVVGVAQSIRPRGLGTGGGEPIVYVSALQEPPMSAEMTAPTIEAGAVRRLALGVRRPGLRAMIGEPFALQDRLRDYEAPLDWFARLMTALAVAATLVAVVGLVALMRQLVIVREREIAVRLALGAKPAQIIYWVVGRSLRITVAGAMISVPVARWMGFVMREHVLGGETGDLTALGLLAAALGALGVLSSVRAAMRAVSVEPSAAWAAPRS